MEFWKKLFSTTFSILNDIWTDLLFKIAGTLFPFYIGGFILLLVDPKLISKVFDPQSFILYSSTFLFSSMYLWYKNLNTKNKTGLLIFLMFLLFAIVISFIYALSFTEKLNKEFSFQSWSYGIFWISILLYIYYECYNYFKAKESNFGEVSKNQFDSFKVSFNKMRKDAE